jgi:hypothetical protein
MSELTEIYLITLIGGKLDDHWHTIGDVKYLHADTVKAMVEQARKEMKADIVKRLLEKSREDRPKWMATEKFTLKDIAELIDKEF